MNIFSIGLKINFVSNSLKIAALPALAIIIFISIWKYKAYPNDSKLIVKQLQSQRLYTWTANENKLVGDKKFKDVIRAIQTLTEEKVLNTKLEQQNLPTYFQIAMNCLQKMASRHDSFKEIRALNVIKEIKAFIQTNQDYIYLNHIQNCKITCFFDSLSDKIGKKYPEEVKELHHLVNFVPCSDWRLLLKLDENQQFDLEKTPFLNDIKNAAAVGDEGAILLLKRVAKFQV